MEVVNVLDKLSLFQEHCKPKIIAQLNDYDIRVVKVSGEFVWHKHDDTDDFFFVLKVGSPSRCVTAMLSWGLESCSSFRRGVEHYPRCDEEVHLLLIEPTGTPNTGDAGGERTVTPEQI